MKTMYRKFVPAAVILLTIVIAVAINGIPPDSTKQNASFYSVKCTVAKFLLSDVDTTRQIAPLFENLGDHKMPITAASARAQDFFNQGIRLTYAFNHPEAHRSFMEAARIDPNAPMAYWGQAYALGPNINDPLPDEERRTKAQEAVAQAVKLMDKGTAKEKALIQALAKRYTDDLSTSIENLNTAYLSAMEAVAAQFPNDANILTLYAAAAMNTMPWAYWDAEGNPSPNTPAAKDALEKAMQINPDHPGAHHYYIHMVELPLPDLGITSAERLENLMPAAGHLVHMPSHIYIRVGRYADAVRVNQLAVGADEDYISQCFAQGMYPLTYYPHNLHFLWSAASLLGDSKTAIDAARRTAEKVPAGDMLDLPFLQDFASIPLLAYTRFGKWNDILTIPNPGDEYKHLKVLWHYARGTAFVRKNNLTEAKEELEALAILMSDPSLADIIANNNTTEDVALIAHNVLSGELALAEGDFPGAVEFFNQGIIAEDNLVYTEPTAWHIPVRQTLGAALLKEGKFKEAEEVFKQDLEKLRQNGWALKGLQLSLEGQGKQVEAEKIREELIAAWKHADIVLTTSIL